MSIYQQIEAYTLKLQPLLEELRMDFHRHPETAWQEVRTSQKIAGLLSEWGYQVHTGQCVSGRETGVIGELDCGTGPVCALRFDIDALPISESPAATHLPTAQGFASEHPGLMHACGHDGHMTIGLGCARLLAHFRPCLSGKIRLIFQPAEEGARGALPITARGWLDDVDIFLSGHIIDRELARGEDANVLVGVSSSFATTKTDVVFHGLAAHAAHPEAGLDVIPAIAAWLCRLAEAPGPGFIHTGTIRAGSSRNIVADYGALELETRAPSTADDLQLNAFLQRTLKETAACHHLRYELSVIGNAPSLNSSPDFCEALARLYCSQLRLVKPASFIDTHFPASEDAAHMMETVKKRSGNAAFLLFPAPLPAGLHHPEFDFPMEVLCTGTAAFSAAVCAALHQ